MGNLENEKLRDEIQRVRQENKRIIEQNISLQKDLNNVIEAHKRAIEVINRLVEENFNAKADTKRRTNSEISFEREKL